MADYFTQFSCSLPLTTDAMATAAEEIYAQWCDGTLIDADSEHPQFEMSIEDGETAERYAWIRDESGQGSANDVILFVQLIAERAPTKGRWGFEWANTCGKPRIDSFGGGAAMVDLESAKCWIHTSNEWLEVMKDGPVMAGEPLRLQDKNAIVQNV